MTVAVITLFDLHNVGNRLQNYAVTSILNKLGFQCETLVPHRMPKTSYRLQMDAEIRTGLKEEPEVTQIKYKKMCSTVRFEDFTEKYIPYKVTPINQYGREIEKAYDYFVVGSDQVWNPFFRNSVGQVENRLLAFAPPDKRVCFAPSVGVDDIPEIWYPLYEKEWSRFRYLSCREDSGAALIKKLTGRDAQVVIDPTLMVDREEWLKISKPLQGFDYDSEYILYYLLGNPEEEISKELLAVIEKQKHKKNLREVRLFDENDPVMASVGPEEILSLFARARLVCTDSFHGTVFSILMGCPFLLIERELQMRNISLDMSARITTLLAKLGLEFRLPKNQKLNDDAIWMNDYTETYKRLEAEREMAAHFLKASFHKEKL